MVEDETGISADEPVVDAAQVAVVALSVVPGGIADLDQTLYEMAPIAVAEGHPLRVRFPLQVYNAKTEQYIPWQAVKFVLAFTAVEQASRFRVDLEAFVRGWVAAELGK